MIRLLRLRFALLLLAAGLSARDGWALVLRPIQVDGAMPDWFTVLASPENTVSDRAWDQGDPDKPPTGTVDLRVFAVTWDSTNLYLYHRRTVRGPSSLKMITLAYIDVNHDGKMGNGDHIFAALYKSGGMAENGLFAYVPNNPAGDPLGGDGVPMPEIGRAHV